MYLSPWTALSSLRASPGRDGTASVVARAFAGALSRWTWIGSGITGEPGDSPESNVGLVAISAAFPSADANYGINGSFGEWPFVAGEETLREDADRRVAAVVCSKCFRRSGEGPAASIVVLLDGSAKPSSSGTT
jgi:hypothetical protein